MYLDCESTSARPATERIQTEISGTGIHGQSPTVVASEVSPTAPSQPDLNFDEPKVQQALLNFFFEFTDVFSLTANHLDVIGRPHGPPLNQVLLLRLTKARQCK